MQRSLHVIRASVPGVILLALLLVLPVIPARGAVSEDVLPGQAEWISASGASPAAQTNFFQRTFEIGSKVVKAVLLAAVDQYAVVMVNDVPAAEVKGFIRAASVDVTRHLRAGTNTLLVRASHTSAPPALRLMLELATADGRQRWVVSDSSWRASPSIRGEWQPAVAHGEAGFKKWGNPFNATHSVDAYNSWMLARGAPLATEAGTLNVPPGFKVELLRSARTNEDSWVALTFDAQGRILVAREKRGLLRMTPGRDAIERVEVIDDSLLECRGLLWAYDALYVNANNSRGFYRLRDPDGDGRFDEKKLLLETGGEVGHGRNHLRLGPDGLIYLVHGDSVALPSNLAANSPLRQMAEDQLLPARGTNRQPAFRPHVQLGHVLQTDREGSYFRLFAGGLRNPLDIDFNEDGELFTYDADNERDIATPWYQPTRVLHVVPGGDYGWRHGPANLPPSAPDTLPAVANIGVGSPTGVAFGTRSHFPERWRRAFFIADWAYGRILAVTPRAEGASYRGTSEEFLSGRPLNVTDLVIGPDGAMYFTTGGRGTKSGLYRVSYTTRADGGRKESDAAQRGAAEKDATGAAALRALRRQLETLARPGADDLDFIWSHLGHRDRWIRHAARTALEHQPVEPWRTRALTERDHQTAVTALLALARNAGREVQPALLARLLQIELTQVEEPMRLEALRVCAVSFVRHGWPGDEAAAQIAARLEALYPAAGREMNFELCRLLVSLRAPGVLAKTTSLLARARTSEELLHHLFQLRWLREGWTQEQRRTFLEALRRAEAMDGAREYYAALRTIRKEAADSLTPGERTALAGLLQPAAPAPVTLDAAAPLAFVREWTLADFDFTAGTRGNAAAGREAFLRAGCAQCHRVGREPGSMFGPDLTAVASRFGRRDLLDHILNPSKAIDEKFRTTLLTLKDGSLLSGVIEREDGETLVLGTAALEERTSEASKAEVVERKFSELSPMPSGLLNGLTQAQVFDLLAYLEAAGVMESK